MVHGSVGRSQSTGSALARVPTQLVPVLGVSHLSGFSVEQCKSFYTETESETAQLYSLRE